MRVVGFFRESEEGRVEEIIRTTVTYYASS